MNLSGSILHLRRADVALDALDWELDRGQGGDDPLGLDQILANANYSHRE